jgi:hypothetical protein
VSRARALVLFGYALFVLATAVGVGALGPWAMLFFLPGGVLFGWLTASVWSPR